MVLEGLEVLVVPQCLKGVLLVLLVLLYLKEHRLGLVVLEDLVGLLGLVVLEDLLY